MKENRPKMFKICADKRLNEYLRQQDNRLAAQIENETDDYINNVDEASYIKYLVDEYKLDTPYLDFDNKSASTGQTLVPSEHLQSYGHFNVRRGQSYPRGTIIYHVPCSGDVSLLQYYTDNYVVERGPVGFVEDGCLCFEIIDIFDDLARVKNLAEGDIKSIRVLSSKLIGEVENYNYGLEWKIKHLLENRKQKINNIIQVLGVPIRKRENLSSSYSLPTPYSRNNISLKPQVTKQGGNIEYTLDEAMYLEILRVIHDYGRIFEQYPSTYGGKKEEELRDHFLLVLQPRYNWMAAGEAFNKVGKTDILIRYEQTTIFIAECKFWRGKKGYIDTINQLLSYLSWRNSKAAVVLFVRNNDFSSVLAAVKKATPTHPNYINFLNEQEDTWLNYIFHINDNPSREVKLAVLLFPIPAMGKASIEEIDE